MPFSIGQLGLGAGDLGFNRGDLVLFTRQGFGVHALAGLRFSSHCGNQLPFEIGHVRLRPLIVEAAAGA